MRKERLIELIKNPEDTTGDELQELEKLTNQYPCFQAVRMLYMKILYLKDNERFQEELPKATIHIADHRQFLSFLHKTPDFFSTVAKPCEKTEESNIEDKDNLPFAYNIERELKDTSEEKQETDEKGEEIKNDRNLDLIDQFIQSEPGMPKISDSPADSRDLSEENPFSEDELFSETLAKIYVKQQLYEKAITTYIKLSLKYPEKSVYFANRIEKIKEIITNKD